MGECDDDPTQEQDDLLEDGHGFGYGGGTPGDVFIRTATGIRKVLPSIFNLKVVSDVTTTCESYRTSGAKTCTSHNFSVSESRQSPFCEVDDCFLVSGNCLEFLSKC
jgi:hypothetical protein